MNPFTQDKASSVASLGELALLERIRGWLGDAAPPPPQGMGDDTAVIPEGSNLLTNDSLVHGRHFDDSASPRQAGAKLLKRNLSDIAAMGGEPRDAVVALFMPPGTRIDWVEGFTLGMRDCALAHGARIVGGDLTETDGFLGATLTLTGFSERPLLRSGAGEGDAIYVTGALGGSIHGHHLDFTPRLTEGRFLRAQQAVVSCIDVTDGLAKDLPALLAPGLAAALDFEALPASPEARKQAAGDPAKLLDHVLRDGEDYELLFTLRAGEDCGAFERLWRDWLPTPLTRIGRIVKRVGEAPVVNARTGRALTGGTGYVHFG